SLAGWALGQAGLKTKTRKGLAALILAANMPDTDVFLGRVPWEPLAMHRGFTHGLAGISLMPPLLAGLLWLLDRWQVSRGATIKSRLEMRWGWLVALCYFGAITHPLLDLLTTYSVQLLSPFSSAWYHADGLFIIDLWLCLLLGTAIFWSVRIEKKGGQWRRPAQAAIGIACAYIGLNLLITDRAVAAVRGWAGERQAEAIFASPQPIYFWRRQLVWREQDCYRRSAFDPLGKGFATVSACQPTNLDDRRVLAAIRRAPALRAFLRWSVLPVAEVEAGRCSTTVSIGDARYGESGARSRLRRQSVVPTGAAGC
ncbi:MAG: metal-dependent hydrolase, partial [Sphingomicrobium sp.]